ncbi:S-layer family protein [Natranaerovirga hydrolytica]|uniref:S-layer family protein n=1 Tax=Natranaerovirga hydrolytica TaxID=680378 RepID=A0A4V2Q1M2_9FIRM|nr:S-layer homology domain-containing protein [Natranaerovirga hydrolytica]TCK98171.1 S-layer family protein [Natranaerovirga hydrolytica]
MKKKVLSKVIKGNIVGYAIMLATIPNFAQVSSDAGVFEGILKNESYARAYATSVNMEDVYLVDTVEDIEEFTLKTVERDINLLKNQRDLEYKRVLEKEKSITPEILDSLNVSKAKINDFDKHYSAYDIGHLIEDKNTIEELKDIVAREFSDVNSTDWFAGEVALGSALNIVSGYTDGTFKPTQEVTRVEFLSMLSRAIYGNGNTIINKQQLESGVGISSNYHYTSNLSKDKWFENEYIMVGPTILPSGFYTLDELQEPITRYEVSYWIHKVWQDIDKTSQDDFEELTTLLLGSDVNDLKFFTDNFSMNEVEYSMEDLINKAGDNTRITDEEKAFGEYYINPVDVQNSKEKVPAWFVLEPIILERFGIYAGYTDGSFGGYSNITRAESVSVLNRLTTPILRTENNNKTLEKYFEEKVEEIEEREGIENGESEIDTDLPSDYDPYTNNGIDGFYFETDHRNVPSWTQDNGNSMYPFYPILPKEIQDLSWEEKAEVERHPNIAYLSPELDRYNTGMYTYQVTIDYCFKTTQQKIDTKAFLTEWHGEEIAEEIMELVEGYSGTESYEDRDNYTVLHPSTVQNHTIDLGNGRRIDFLGMAGGRGIKITLYE